MRVDTRLILVYGEKANTVSNFGILIKVPDSDKSGKEKCCWFTLYSKKDFQKVVKDEQFFENWEWGVYGKYFDRQ